MLPKFSVEQNVIRLIRANFLSSVGIKVKNDTNLQNELSFGDIDFDKLATLIEWYFSVRLTYTGYKDWITVDDVVKTVNQVLEERKVS